MKRKIVALLIVATVSGCGFLPQAPKRTDTRTVFVWPMDVCPSQSAGGSTAGRSLIAGLFTTLLGNVVSGLVGIPAAALASAAEADAQGLKATGTNARYYYDITNSAADGVTVKTPGCYVVAYAAPSQTSKAWCSDAGFAKSVSATCGVGASRLSQLKLREPLGNVAQPGVELLTVPEFYAEIAFEQSNLGDVVRPYLAAVHYPDSIIHPGSSKPRMLSLLLEFSSAQKDDPMKAATISMVIPSITPQVPVDAASQAHLITGWTSVPSKFSITPPTLAAGDKTRFLPVTIKATFNEVGDPSKFLQAFAKAFAGSAGEYSKAITAEISPLGQESAAQDKDKKSADFSAALAAAQKSRADLLTACAGNPSTTQAKATAQSLFTAAVANQKKANLAADQAGAARPFSSPDSVADTAASCWS
jgi:hypothetical protein